MGRTYYSFTSANEITRLDFAGRQFWIEHFPCAFRAAYWQSFGIEETYLHQHAGLVPVDMLMRNFSVFESRNHRHGHFNGFPGGRNAGQKPVDHSRMREADDELIDNL